MKMNCQSCLFGLCHRYSALSQSEQPSSTQFGDELTTVAIGSHERAMDKCSWLLETVRLEPNSDDNHCFQSTGMRLLTRAAGNEKV
jgi:hypothetical protein